MLKYTKFAVGWGSAPDPAGGAYSAPPDPLGLRENKCKEGIQTRDLRQSGMKVKYAMHALGHPVTPV